jgi:hypothetical protein
MPRLDDLPWRMPIFGDLEKALDKHVAAFCKDLGFDLGDKKLKCNSLWINILPEGGTHASHIHPHSVISGTTYVAMPEGTSALKLEDPRLPMMMLAPVPLKSAPQELQRFVYVKPAVGEVLLWESWLRHEVPDEHVRGRADLGQLQLWVGLAFGLVAVAPQLPPCPPTAFPPIRPHPAIPGRLGFVGLSLIRQVLGDPSKGAVWRLWKRKRHESRRTEVRRRRTSCATAWFS